jgi:hypothetical protein
MGLATWAAEATVSPWHVEAEYCGNGSTQSSYFERPKKGDKCCLYGSFGSDEELQAALRSMMGKAVTVERNSGDGTGG